MPPTTMTMACGLFTDGIRRPMNAPEIILLYAGDSSDGSEAREEVVLERLGAMRFKVVQSPGLVLGIAAGDVIEVSGDRFKIVTRGQNVAIQVFAREGLDELEQRLTSSLSKLGGWLDGRAALQLVYTVPVSAGFPAIEQALRQTVAQYKGAEWYYGNVYDNDDGVTPLNWWLPT